MNIEEIRGIATTVRKEFESGEVDRELLEKIFRECRSQPVSNAHYYVQQALRQFPKNCCEIASVYLQTRLHIGHLEHGLYEDRRCPSSGGHGVLLLDHSMIADITADQFGGPPVYVGPLRHPWRLPNASIGVQLRSMLRNIFVV